jgi:DedD protein
MAFFKFRKGGDDHAATPPPPAPESIEAMRKRARHRLIGAAVLVLLGVIGFPMLFDSQPRPIAVDIPIEIPDKNKVKSLGNVAVALPSKQVSGMIDEGPAPKPAPSIPAIPAPAVVAPAAVPVPAEAPVPKPVAKAESKPVEKMAEMVVAKPVVAAAGRFVVQVGAFAELAKAHEARVKLEKAGLKTYTQVVQPKEGKRIRVRVGPFETKADADKAAQKIKKLDLPAAILEL